MEQSLKQRQQTDNYGQANIENKQATDDNYNYFLSIKNNYKSALSGGAEDKVSKDTVVKTANSESSESSERS